MEPITKDLNERVAKAVSHYWLTRENQARKQEGSGRAEHGLRSAVTGGHSSAMLPHSAKDVDAHRAKK